MLVDVATVAKGLELSPRRVQQLASEGWLPREGRGEYDLAACLHAYARYLEEIEGRRGVGGAIDRARARKYDAQAALQELELAIESGELLEEEDVRDRFGRRLQVVRRGLLNLPSIAARVAGRDREARERILGEALTEIVDDAFAIQARE